MLIHTVVENAIKHGVRNTAAGMLQINITKYENKLQIAIEDNGPGMQAVAGSSGTGTGKGLKILQELTDYFYKLEKIRITFNLNNIAGDTGSITGTRAVIRL
jgi:sensor histidine kinase YesM